jgi:CO dehydrogenase/acetyl-CoA synthase delta subunit
VNIEEAIRELLDAEEVELDNVSIEAEELIFEINQMLTSFRPIPPKAVMAHEERKARYKFTPPIKEYPRFSWGRRRLREGAGGK